MSFVKSQTVFPFRHEISCLRLTGVAGDVMYSVAPDELDTTQLAQIAIYVEGQVRVDRELPDGSWEIGDRPKGPEQTSYEWQEQDPRGLIVPGGRRRLTIVSPDAKWYCLTHKRAVHLQPRTIRMLDGDTWQLDAGKGVFIAFGALAAGGVVVDSPGWIHASSAGVLLAAWEPTFGIEVTLP
jgi:hypothetical protein